jgi:hypothetical protein
MFTRSFVCLAAALGLAGCLFTGAGTEGLPCNGNGECGPGQQCIERICCRDASRCAAGGGEEETETETAAETSLPSSSDDDAVREVCDDSDTVCVNGSVLRYCSDDGKLTTTDCRGVCGEFLETAGCHHLSMQDRDTCVCTFEIEQCTSQGASRCDGNGLEVCDGGIWERGDCDDVCIGAGYGGADYCSGGTCYCGSACQDDALRCSDSNTNAICFGGTWYPESCTTICRDAGYDKSLGCFYYPGNDSACMCV